MDYVKPYGVVDSMLAGGAVKLSLPPRQLLLRGMLAGAYLGIGTSMAVTVAVETGYWIIGSLLFPFGLALAILLGAEIITGSFALLPCAAVAGQKNAGLRQVLPTGVGSSSVIFSEASYMRGCSRLPSQPPETRRSMQSERS